MPEVKLEIGGRVFPVVCEPGEEAQLARAAALLDREATRLLDQHGRIPETRMLLMAGLIMADRSIEADAVRERADRRIAALQEDLSRSEATGTSRDVLDAASATADAAKATLGRAADRLEAVADMIEAL
ncbi:MAG: cell division protein ZapA [Pseudomonadota bacterium]